MTGYVDPYVRAVPGTPYEVRAAKGSDIKRLLVEEMSQIDLNIALAQCCTYHAEGEHEGQLVWATTAEAEDAPWPLLQRCSELASEMNSGVEGAEGN